jgi:hypothetical protein
LNYVGLVLIGSARLSRSFFQIKSLLISYRAGAHCNLITHDVSPLYSEEGKETTRRGKGTTRRRQENRDRRQGNREWMQENRARAAKTKAGGRKQEQEAK